MATRQERKLARLERDSPPNILTWKTVVLGTFQTMRELREALLQNGCEVDSYAAEMLNITELSKERQEIDLVKLSNADLGFPKGTELGNTYSAAKALGLSPCPAEVGPQLCLTLPDFQSSLWIASDEDWSFKGAEKDFVIFHRAKEGKLELSSIVRNLKRRWSGESTFIFRK